jgi:broad specificity phosphatase PhoE
VPKADQELQAKWAAREQEWHRLAADTDNQHIRDTCEGHADLADRMARFWDAK